MAQDNSNTESKKPESGAFPTRIYDFANTVIMHIHFDVSLY